MQDESFASPRKQNFYNPNVSRNQMWMFTNWNRRKQVKLATMQSFPPSHMPHNASEQKYCFGKGSKFLGEKELRK